MVNKRIKILIFSIATSLCLIANITAQSKEETLRQGREIFEKYQEAIGGKENLAAIKTVEIKSETERSSGKTRDTSIQDRTNKKSYARTETADGRIIELGSDGSRSWMRQGGRADYINLDSNDFVEAKEYKKLPNQKIDGKEYLVVEEVKSGGNQKTFYDPNTFLLLRRESQGAFGNNSVNISTTYSDYRKVGEILVPFLETTENSFSGKSTKKIISVKHNIEISASLFELYPKEKKDDNPKPTTPKTDDDLAKKKAALEATGFDTSELKDISDSQQLKDFASKNTIYQDESGKVITEKEFEEKIASGNSARGRGQIGNGKLTVRLRKVEVNVAAPDFKGTLLDGSTVQLSSLKGKVVVLNFWFTACAPCIKEMPELNELVKKYQANNDVQFYSVTYNTKEEVAEFLQKHKFEYQPIVLADEILETFKNPSYPTHIVIDREGKIQLSQLGYSPKIKEKLIEKIEAALKMTS